MRQKFMKSLLLISCFLLVLVIRHSVGKGGRGGRRRSIKRYGSGESPSPGGRYDRFTRYSRATGNRWTVSGIDEYRARFNGTEHYDEDPSLCYTDDLTIPNYTFEVNSWRTHTGYFVCPYNGTYSYIETYCCGDKDKQHCCIFWDDAGRKAGGIIGIILLGGLVGVGPIILVIVFALRCRRINQSYYGKCSSGKDSETTEEHVELNGHEHKTPQIFDDDSKKQKTST